MMLAIDIGGTKIAAANVVDGACVDRRQVPMPSNEEEFLQAIRFLALNRPQSTHAAVAVTGYTDGVYVRGVNQSTIPFWSNYPLVPRLRELLGCPVTAINDAQAAAWGEYLPRREQCRDLLFMTLSTGVGGGLVLDGALRLGASGLAGHLGHATVDVAPIDGQMTCGCGRQGCLEAIASGTALARQATFRFGCPVSSIELFRRALEGDSDAVAILDLAALAVARAIANAHAQLDLQRVVLGGSVGLAPSMADRIASALSRFPALYHVPIELALLGADAGLLGASAWASHFLSN